MLEEEEGQQREGAERGRQRVGEMEREKEEEREIPPKKNERERREHGEREREEKVGRSSPRTPTMRGQPAPDHRDRVASQPEGEETVRRASPLALTMRGGPARNRVKGVRVTEATLSAVAMLALNTHAPGQAEEEQLFRL